MAYSTMRASRSSKAGITKPAPKMNHSTSDSRLPASSVSSTDSTASVRCRRAEHEPADERRDERVPTGLRCDEERQQRQRQRGQPSGAVLHPAALTGQAR